MKEKAQIINDDKVSRIVFAEQKFLTILRISGGEIAGNNFSKKTCSGRSKLWMMQWESGKGLTHFVVREWSKQWMMQGGLEQFSTVASAC